MFERNAQHISDRLVELGGIADGQQVLDIATGIGEPAVTAARRVGSDGRVIGTDLSPGMLAIAEERAAELSLDSMEFKQMDAESLDFPDETFHTILCRWGLMFMPNLSGVLARIRGMLRPGGKFVASIWSVPEMTPGISLPMGVIQKVIQLPEPPPEAPHMYRLSPPGVLEQAFKEAGFRSVQVERHMVDFAFSSIEDYISFLQEVAAVITILLANETEARRTEVWRMIAEAARGFSNGDGEVSLPSETILVVGER
jgi:ubiquinone/menaquinone biosynthesis C-methylase UbiE